MNKLFFSVTLLENSLLMKRLVTILSLLVTSYLCFAQQWVKVCTFTQYTIYENDKEPVVVEKEADFAF